MHVAATQSLDYFFNNLAPDADACTVRVETPNKEYVSITVWRCEDQSVHIEVEDCDGNRVDAVLGEESVTYKD